MNNFYNDHNKNDMNILCICILNYTKKMLSDDYFSRTHLQQRANSHGIFFHMSRFSVQFNLSNKTIFKFCPRQGLHVDLRLK